MTPTVLVTSSWSVLLFLGRNKVSLKIEVYQWLLICSELGNIIKYQRLIKHLSDSLLLIDTGFF